MPPGVGFGLVHFNPQLSTMPPHGLPDDLPGNGTLPRPVRQDVIRWEKLFVQTVHEDQRLETVGDDQDAGSRLPLLERDHPDFVRLEVDVPYPDLPRLLDPATGLEEQQIDELVPSGGEGQQFVGLGHREILDRLSLVPVFLFGFGRERGSGRKNFCELAHENPMLSK